MKNSGTAMTTSNRQSLRNPTPDLPARHRRGPHQRDDAGAIAAGGASLALLDFGFTYNFISEEAAGHVTLQLHPWGKMLVTVANGERVPCPGMYHR
jgi:hypothetical protein